MLIARVVGQVVSTQKHRKFEGAKLLLVQPLTVDDAPRGPVVLEVVALADRRQPPPKARELYRDHSPPPPPREERVAVRPRGAGRPTKAERRARDRFVRG